MKILKRIHDLIGAYEKILFLNIDNPESIITPHQAYGLIVNLLATVTGFFAVSQSGVLLINIGQAAIAAFFVIMAWAILTRVFCKNMRDFKKILSLHLNYVTFWIAITIFLILLSSWWYEDPLDKTPRFFFVFYILVISTPLHIFLSKLSLLRKIIYAPLLVSSCALLPYATFLR